MRTIRESRSTPGFLGERSYRNSQGVNSASSRVGAKTQCVFVVDNDPTARNHLQATLQSHGFDVEPFRDGHSFLEFYRSGRHGCILVDASMPMMSGIELVKILRTKQCHLPAIAISDRFAPAMVVEAMKAGASDCLEKPINKELLVSTIERVMDAAQGSVDTVAFRNLATQRVSTLTTRQREILDLMAAGHPSKNIAADLGISQRTVENHRAAIARKTCSKSLSEVIHKAVCANCSLMKTTQH